MKAVPTMKALATLLIHLCLTASAVAADAYPSRPITIVVPQLAGGGSDIVTRLVAQKMSTILKESLVVDNRVGAGGNIGTTLVARAKPDGYTVLMNGNSHAINPALYRNAGFDPMKDFVPVGLLARGTLLLVAHPSFPANTVAELIAEAKRSPGKLFYASPGNGTVNHLAMAMLEQAAGVQFTHVPYKGQPAAMTDVVGGQIPFTFTALASSQPYIEAGKLKVLAVTNEERLPALPRTPTIAETIPGYSVTPWYGLFAPAGTAEAIVDKLHQAANTALQDPSVRDSLARQGITAAQDTREQFTRQLNREVPLWAKTVKDSGARLD